MNSFFLALRFLTVIPLGKRREANPASIVAAGKYYPVIGLIIGGIAWVFYYGIFRFFPIPVSVGLLLIFGVIMTGALHLDGLADCLDGFYGGTNREERLAIMKDVHLGTMGVVGLILILGIKYLLLREMMSFPSLWRWIILIPAVSRWTPVFLAFLFKYARPGGGLGQALVSGTGKKELFWATLLSWTPILVLSGFYGWGLIMVTMAWSLLCGWYFFRKVGGITGDTLGAVIESSEVWAMLYIVGMTRYA
ncbi:MAG: adenosylcobinamide-GDP ribazoletransferase [Syntrophales bacterium LBB04]|nr:adenosylcobinamide-GDP ribazoletransferase [Syntrophales bacterium LBB04]